MDQNMSGMKCGCSHHKMVPLLVALIGLLFLLQALTWLDSGLVSILWPILLILIGLQKMMANKCKCCDRP